MTVRLCLVVAMARNRAIGQGGGMPWRISADLRYFKALTMGKPMIMGRKTFESIGRPLPGRANIVVTRRADFAADGTIVAGDFESACSEAERIADTDGVPEIMVIGGGEIYAAALPIADRIYMTEVDIDAEGDVFFPPLDRSHWHEAARTAHPPTDDAPGFSFVVLERYRVSGKC